jgi:hypothetical protein
MFDGTTVSMPDTAANQKAYPQVYNQKSGLGFPIARVGAIMSLCCGAILNLGVCRYAGKGQSELGMLRTLWNLFQPGDVLLADRLMCAWTEMVMLKQRGVDSVCRFRLTAERIFAVASVWPMAITSSNGPNQPSPGQSTAKRTMPSPNS